jgi:protein-L-isoaspartate(D-aspartate) O-methyltransferase
MIYRRAIIFLVLIISSACQAEGTYLLASPSPKSTIETAHTSLPTIEISEPTAAESPLESTQDLEETPKDIDEEQFLLGRNQLIEEVRAYGIDDEDVLMALERVPRHEFVPPELVKLAYVNNALPIGYGQTISQPFIVALMTQSIEPKPGQRVLEIGTGSGYQAAVLAELGMEVYTIEIIPDLAEMASERLTRLGYSDIHTLNADGYFGWEEHAPFDAVVVTAAPDHLPQPLANQLVEGGRLVIPIGPIGFVQTLWLFEKIDGELLATNLGGVRFVPFTGDH